jgi:cell fate (sporulation/competence/biofilm development) regulator YmcA (YheA/YmcA/DUF963 family)
MSEKEKLILMLKENEDIKRYQRLEKLINSNKELKSKMGELKSIQKQLVNAKHIGKTQAIESFQNRYDELYQSLLDYPLMSDYMALQSDINELLQSIVAIIEEGIEKDFE